MEIRDGTGKFIILRRLLRNNEGRQHDLTYLGMGFHCNLTIAVGGNNRDTREAYVRSMLLPFSSEREDRPKVGRV